MAIAAPGCHIECGGADRTAIEKGTTMKATTPAETMTAMSSGERAQEAAAVRFDRVGRICSTIFMAALAVMFAYAYLAHFAFN
jgi:hypothetical protein